MHALRHQSRRGPELCEGLVSDEISGGDFGEWFKRESHKLLCPKRLVDSDVGAYTQKPWFLLRPLSSPLG